MHQNYKWIINSKWKYAIDDDYVEDKRCGWHCGADVYFADFIESHAIIHDKNNIIIWGFIMIVVVLVVVVVVGRDCLQCIGALSMRKSLVCVRIVVVSGSGCRFLLVAFASIFNCAGAAVTVRRPKCNSWLGARAKWMEGDKDICSAHIWSISLDAVMMQNRMFFSFVFAVKCYTYWKRPCSWCLFAIRLIGR